MMLESVVDVRASDAYQSPRAESEINWNKREAARLERVAPLRFFAQTKAMEQKSWPPSYHRMGYVQNELEWPALAAGFVVGCAWWMLHRACFVDIYWMLAYPFKNAGFTFQKFDVVYELINLEFAFSQALPVGLVVGLFSRDKPYLLTFLAVAATFAAKFFVLDFPNRVVGGNIPRPVSEIEGGMICYAIIYLTIPILGAYLAHKWIEWMQKRRAKTQQF